MIAKPCKSPVTYSGGKQIYTKWILPILAKYPHTRYVEPFGGGGSVLLTKKPGFDVYNDIYSPLLDADWSIIRKEVECNILGKSKNQRNQSKESKKRVECLYCSPGREKTLFDEIEQ